jgi:hypothetical protein
MPRISYSILYFILTEYRSYFLQVPNNISSFYINALSYFLQRSEMRNWYNVYIEDVVTEDT